LDPDRTYEWIGKGEFIGGDELMHAGIVKPQAKHDYASVVYRFRAV
ncbi:GH36 C-terminal domain-containing protein, partial [Paenibacillus sepulcri]|nr:GH36 C-terminal domain-containing protein [Paenibacillus sepulcri]